MKKIINESQLAKIVEIATKNALKKLIKESVEDNVFYRVQLCSDEGEELDNGEDFPTYEEAVQYLSTINPEIGERIEIYKMEENEDKIDFIDQVY